MDIVKLGQDGQLALPIEMYTSERVLMQSDAA
jgi:hypothetical protein